MGAKNINSSKFTLMKDELRELQGQLRSRYMKEASVICNSTRNSWKNKFFGLKAAEEQYTIVLPDLLPPLDAFNSKKKCLVVDMDETLISRKTGWRDDDGKNEYYLKNNPDFVFEVKNDSGKEFTYVKKRPHLDEFLKHIGSRFECVLWTTGIREYADPLLDLIDPQRVFSTRLFREHCKSGYSHGSVKDLSTLGRDMRNVIYVDDEPIMLHPHNTIEIRGWSADWCGNRREKEDDEGLLKLLPILDKLSNVDDIYSVLSPLQFPDAGRFSHHDNVLAVLTIQAFRADVNEIEQKVEERERNKVKSKLNAPLNFAVNTMQCKLQGLKMQANESGLSLTVSHLQQQAEPLRAVEGHQKLQYIMEHRVPFILRCVHGPTEIRRVHEQERYKEQEYGPGCGPKMDKLISTINCFTLAPPTSKITRQLSDDDNKEGIYLIYAGFSNFLRVCDGRKGYYCYTAPLQPEPQPWYVERGSRLIREMEQDAICFLFELVPLDGGHFAIRSYAYRKFLRYHVESNEANEVRRNIYAQWLTLEKPNKGMEKIAYLENILPDAKSIECATRFLIEPITTIETSADGNIQVDIGEEE